MKDRYSVGIVILEILVGTELVISARVEELVEKLVDDCETYLDLEMTRLIRYLILDEGQFNISEYVKKLICKTMN